MIKEILTLDVVNKNNRIYPKLVMEAAIINAANLINDKRLFVVGRIPTSIEINLVDVAGIVNEIKIVENKVMVDVELINTEAALPFRDLLELDLVHVTIGGEGSVTKNKSGQYVVGNDYTLTHCIFTFDPA